MKRAPLLLLVLFALPVSGISHPVPRAAGLSPGMTGEQALTVLRNRHLSVKATYRPCLDDYLAERRKTVSMAGPGRCLQTLSTKYAGGDLLVFLSEDLPNHPGTTRVNTVALNFVADSAVLDVMREAGTDR